MVPGFEPQLFTQQLKMIRQVARAGSNQAEIVQALRNADCTVQHLYLLGKGAPDLLIEYASSNYLLELKNGNKRSGLLQAVVRVGIAESKIEPISLE